MSDIFITFYASQGGNVAGIVSPTLVTGTCLVTGYSAAGVTSPSLVTGTVVLSAVLLGAVESTTLVEGEFCRENSKLNWVAWSKIGEAKIELDKNNDSGAAPMKWPGKVYQILPLGQAYIVYGSGGVTKMYPVSTPAPTFGFDEVCDFGIKSRGCAAGSRDVHFFISVNGCLCRIQDTPLNRTPKLDRLGYEEFLGVLDTDALMFYLAEEQKLFISDGSVGYTFTDEGLGGGYATLTAVASHENGTYYAKSATVSCPIALQTNIIDFGLRDVKTLKQLILSADTPSAYSFSIYYRFKTAEVWKQTIWQTFNSYGEGFPWVSGCEFKIMVKADAKPDVVEIQDLTAVFQTSDRAAKGVIQ